MLRVCLLNSSETMLFRFFDENDDELLRLLSRDTARSCRAPPELGDS